MLSRSLASSHLRHRLPLLILPLLLLTTAQGLFAQDGCSKSDIERALIGKTLVSKVQVGGAGTARAGLMTARTSVDTILYPVGGPQYRADWQLEIFGIQGQFPVGTSLRVAKVSRKGNFVELVLEDQNGRKADVRVIVGTMWAAGCDPDSLSEFLRPFFDLPHAAAAPANSLFAISDVQPTLVRENPPSASSNQLPPKTSGGQKTHLESTSPEIPGRISVAQLATVMTAADRESSQINATLLSQSKPLSDLLCSLLSKVTTFRDLGRHPLILQIRSLQSRLGKSLQPQTPDDVEELSQLVEKARRIFGVMMPSNTAQINAQVTAEFREQLDQQTALRNARDHVNKIESELNQNDLITANDLYKALAADSSFAFVRQYQEATQNLQVDLAAYAEAAQLDKGDTSSLPQEAQIVVLEATLLIRATDKPIAGSFLRTTLAKRDADLRRRIDGLQPLQLGEVQSEIPANLKTTTPQNAQRKVSFLESHISSVDSLRPDSDIVKLAAQDNVLTLLRAQLGNGSVDTLKARAAEMAAAFSVRAVLVAELDQTHTQMDQYAKAAEEKKAAEAVKQAQIEATRPALIAFADELKPIQGRRFRVAEGRSVVILQHIIHQIPSSQFVDLVSLYKSLEGLDGTTTREALALDKRIFVGKYYMLQGDVFQIKADRDYPREGTNEFAEFGNVKLLADYFVPVNVDCISREKVPPYTIAATLGKIIDFTLSQNHAGKTIIVPVIQVVAVASPSNRCGYPDEIIINQ